MTVLSLKKELSGKELPLKEIKEKLLDICALEISVNSELPPEEKITKNRNFIPSFIPKNTIVKITLISLDKLNNGGFTEKEIGVSYVVSYDSYALMHSLVEIRTEERNSANILRFDELDSICKVELFHKGVKNG